MRLSFKQVPLRDVEIANRFEAEIRNHEGLIHSVCRMYTSTRADHQDLFQDIVIQLWRAFPGFKGKAKLSTWLYRVSINTAISGWRKRDRLAYTPMSASGDNDLIDETGVSEEENSRRQQLHDAIKLLNEVEKAIVMLYMEDRSYSEMEEILGMNEGAIRVKMSRIKEKLRQLTKTNRNGA